MTKPTRRTHSIDQQVLLLRRHILDKVPVSDLCDEVKLRPSVFYAWQHKLLDNAAAALVVPRGRPPAVSRERQLEEEVKALQAKLAKKDAVIAEIAEEFTRLKKEIGEP